VAYALILEGLTAIDNVNRRGRSPNPELREFSPDTEDPQVVLAQVSFMSLPSMFRGRVIYGTFVITLISSHS
jgi:hypothetical protein